MKEQWLQLQERFLTLPEQRRKFWFGLSILVVLYLGVWLALIPSYESWQQGQAQVKQQQSQLAGLTRELDNIKRRLAGDPSAPLLRQREQLAQRLADIDTQLSAQTQYVSASDNRNLLKALLSAGGGVKVKSAEALPAEQVYEDPQNPQSGIFKHRLQWVVSGSYFEIRDYLQAVENLPWSFNWSRLEYRVISHPTAEVQLEIYTLSLERDYVAS